MNLKNFLTALTFSFVAVVAVGGCGESAPNLKDDGGAKFARWLSTEAQAIASKYSKEEIEERHNEIVDEILALLIAKTDGQDLSVAVETLPNAAKFVGQLPIKADCAFAKVNGQIGVECALSGEALRRIELFQDEFFTRCVGSDGSILETSSTFEATWNTDAPVGAKVRVSIYAMDACWKKGGVSIQLDAAVGETNEEKRARYDELRRKRDEGQDGK